MKLVLAMMQHETNTYSSVPTPLGRFARGGQGEPPRGADALRRFRRTGSGLGAFIELAEAAGAEIVLPIAANAAPSGRVHDDAYEAISDAIVGAVRGGCDAILLDLHGAMVTQTHEDGEGELLRRIRAVAPGVPIGVSLDMHTNLYPAMVELSTAIAGYQTYPHIDAYETGLRAGRALLAHLQGKARCTMAWGNRPMLPHVMRQGTDDEPNKSLQARCRQMEAQGALCASVFVGFPNADIPNAGLSAVVVTDNDPAQARAWTDELLDMAWSQRAAFVYRFEPLADSMARAREIGESKPAGTGPVVLLDHSDNCASGGTMDTMTVLGAMLDAGLTDAAAFAVYDPDAVRTLMAAGVGAEVTLALGGKLDMPAIGLKGQPRTLTGRVRRLSDGQFVNFGPMGRGTAMSMGPSAVLEVGGIEIAVISNHVEPSDMACFAALGLAVERKRYVMLKSRIHWRAGLRPMAHAVVECAGTGVCTSDYDLLAFKNVRRPIYPVDAI